MSCRQYFEESPVFQTMFSLPVGENQVHDGSTKSQPLHLEGIAASDFAAFVDLMNPGLVFLPFVYFPKDHWFT